MSVASFFAQFPVHPNQAQFQGGASPLGGTVLQTPAGGGLGYAAPLPGSVLQVPGGGGGQGYAQMGTTDANGQWQADPNAGMALRTALAAPPPNQSVDTSQIRPSGVGVKPLSRLGQMFQAMHQGPQQGQAALSSGSLIRIRNPQTGLVHVVPSDQVDAALTSGGVRA
jgi:hypothetical protein